MSNKNINTRIALKYDSYANWQLHNPVLIKGEIAIAELPEGSNSTNPSIQNTPNVLIKVGDGANHYNDLKFVSAMAADVYSWAKAATKPSYSASEIDGLADYINGEIQDTNTQYQIVPISGSAYSYKLQKKEIGETGWTDVTGSTITLSDIDNRLDALEAAIVTGGAVETMITEKIGNLDYSGKADNAGKFVTNVTEVDGIISVTAANLVADDIPELAQSKITGLTTALAGKQANLAFDGEYNSDSNKVATVASITSRIQNLDGVAGEDVSTTDKIVAEVTQADGIVTVKKIAINDILPDVADTANGFVTAVSQTNGQIAVTHEAVTDVLGIADNYDKTNNKIATVATVTAAVADLNGAMHFRGTSTTDPTSEAGATVEGIEAFHAGDVVLFGYDEYVYNGSQWIVLGNESIYALKTEVADSLAGKQDNLSFDGTYSSSNKVATVSTVTNAIQALDSSIAEESKKVISGFSIQDGTIEASSVKKVTLADVATSGKIEDISQDGLVIINCGNATTNITASDAAAITL